MDNEIVILKGAEEDLLEAYIIFSERNRGEAFYAAINSSLEQIKKFPDSGPEVFKGFHRVITKKFPYGIFYKKNGNRIFISAISDLRQNPESLLKKLK